MKSDPPDDDREVLNVEDWAEIRRLHRAVGMPIRAIARQLGVGRNTVRRALARGVGPALLQDDVLIAELPDTVAPPWLLRPWFEGDRDVR
jgi:DNA invertase Pin-like site-specific DNA recombinase